MLFTSVKRLLTTFCLSAFLFSSISLIAFADDPPTPGGAGDANGAQAINNPTVLPQTTKEIVDCKALILKVEGDKTEVRKVLTGEKENIGVTVGGASHNFEQNDILGCGIKTGHIKLWMVPFYIREILEFVIGLSGLIAVGGFVYGSYVYMFGGLVDEKEKGKKALLYSIGGMILTLVAWAVVNIFVSIVSSF